MKKTYMLSALLCASISVFTSCVEENLENLTPANKGDEIVFGARAGFENAKSSTKTEYAGTYYEVETNGVTKKFERINWIHGKDMIEIYCPEALNGTKGHYVVSSFTDQETQKDYTYLTRYEDSSLQWSDAEIHHFYAMYPSSRMFNEESTLYQGVKMNGTILTGIIPPSQKPSKIEKIGNNWVASPNMDYAYMAAKGTAVKADGSVSLTFVPIVTAVQIELTLDGVEGTNYHPVQIAEIAVQGTGISGGFTSDLSEWETAYPTCSLTTEGTGSTIQIPVWVNDQPITLNAGESLTFTVFLRPGVNYENLAVAISPNGAAYTGKKMQGVTIPSNLKTRITSFRLPAISIENEEITFDASHWMEQIEPETAMNKLSIPGSGGSFSYNYNSTNPTWYKQQTLTFEQQWKAGIRAFEIVSDRPSSSTATLGTQDVKCNKVSMGVTVLEVLNNLLSKVSTPREGKTEPSECAVLILTYQPEGVTGNARNAVSYASSLKLMYDGLSDNQKKQIIQYTPDLTLEQAKGNVMIFCRINQKDENDAADVTIDGVKLNAFQQASKTLEGTSITLIDGCGTGKDRWGSRGYLVNGNVAYDAANTDDENKSVDYYLTQKDIASGIIDFNWVWPDWNSVKRPDSDDPELNFAFGTNYNNIICWYQEWARVIPESIIGANGYYQKNGTVVFGSQISAHTRWYESYNEKLKAAQKTFNMAISDQYQSYVFINSLCGYFVDPAIGSSTEVFTGSNTGGIAGNIKALADKINPEFYAHVLEAADKQTTGPTGIVMMDYVKLTPDGDNDGGYYLPGVIIANNRKFGTGNSSNSGGSGTTDTENPGGGNQGGGNEGGGNEGGGNGGDDAWD